MTRPHISELAEALQRGRLALFFGADLPHEVTGLPSRADLARELARRKGLDESLSLAEIAQRVSRSGNRWEFTAFVRDALDTAGKPPQPLHWQIVHLVKMHRIETVITTAYDNLLELAFQETDIGINCVVRGSDVSFINPDRPTLIKLYGDAGQPDTLVITEDDHYGLWRDRDKEDLLNEVRTVLRKNVVLFLGYDLSDPDFNLLWREVLDRAGRFPLGAYAVWPGLPEADVQMWRDRGITILDADLLEVLDQIIPQPAPPGRPAATITVPQDAARTIWNTEAIRQLLTAAFDDGELTDLCFDNFRSVYEDFGSGMSKRQKIQRLLDYCVRHNQLKTLLEQVKRRNSAQYAHFAPHLRREPLPQGDRGTPGSERLKLADVLTIHPEHDGRPHKAGPAQWFSRLRIESNTLISGCWGKIYEIHQLTGPNDRQGASLLELHASYLSWGSRGRSGLFAPISIQPGDTEYLDLAWRAHGDPSIPDNQLRVASALDQGKRDTQSPGWGMRQDFIPLEPGYYLLMVQIWAEGYDAPVERMYRLHWPGPGQEDNIRLMGIAKELSKGDGELSGPMPPHGTANRWAVLVGINQYQDETNYGQLQVCVKDVAAVREQLIAGGFDPARIRLLTDYTEELPTRANILVALKAVADATEPDDLLLFYYSGHGDEDDKTSYLVARDGRRLVLGDTAVPLSRVREIMERSLARAKVIVLDACHSGADIGGKGPKPMSAEFIRRVFEQAEGLAVLASCKQGQVSYEWRENERSVFTHFLLEALTGNADRDEKGFVTVQDTSRHVTNGVKLWASQRNVSQTPTLQCTVAGDIILVRCQQART